ncbi:hypothetical protein A3734_06545 [Sulfitobacter sp. HI0054]|uniref:hypothetical protein n=1 Tax=Sulfitobacter sp. HI0054 TaxID=1822238 RepID=UPI0007C287F3|nr:hypothetical protein [Sulfitobacter sp. HI0054]KZY51015.1 hypothetical protein A3734_06545 [Sulfitobacter sp. HI0054]
MTEPTTILMEEKPLDSIIRDTYSVACAFALILPGHAIGSAALQWVGFVLFFVVICTRAAGLRKKYTMSIPEARAKLDELEASA